MNEITSRGATAALATCGVALLLAACKTAPPATMPEGGMSGFLCCNMHPDGEWMSDINFNNGLYPTLPLGTPVKATAYGSSRVRVESGGKVYWLGNDHSRKIDMDTFARRYIVAENPRAALDAMSARDREAILSSRITLGMTQRQVAMALGYPIDTANVSARAASWTYWTSGGVDYRIEFDDAGRVRDVIAGTAIRRAVLME